MVYDRTCRGRALLPGLTHAWWTGGVLYRGLRRFDAWYGARTWSEEAGKRVPIRPLHGHTWQ